MSPIVNNKAVNWSCQIEMGEKLQVMRPRPVKRRKTVREHPLRIARQGAGQCHDAVI
jgi:hypothetical protein